jgi:hypothetical protein
MGIEQGSGRVELSATEEQLVYALAERTQAFLRELNPVQRVLDQAEEHWIHEILPEAATQEHERAVWATALRVISQFLSERLAPLNDMEKLRQGVLQGVRAHPNVVVEARKG